MITETKCSKCNGAMIEGFVVDRGDYSVKMKQEWVEGAPERSFWTGLKTGDRETYDVQAFRCADCSYLEFYTTDKIDT